ncbi:MAG: hypoxanthine phosphoribosyltransferase [Actinomycetota bacterium]|nr:hypoxanthine phosphoribosyltransferase [Actinomycetota bacterium]
MTVFEDGTVELLISKRDLEQRIAELGREIARDLSGDQLPVLISVLKGSALFLADLVRALRIELEVDFMSISSYAAGTAGSGVVRILKDLESDVTSRDVLIVEDIVDTGLTLNYLRRNLSHREVGSLKAVTLLDKAVRRIVPVELEYIGFEIPDVFVVGYGLDFQGIYRNVPEILAVRDIARLANDPNILVEALFGSDGVTPH